MRFPRLIAVALVGFGMAVPLKPNAGEVPDKPTAGSISAGYNLVLEQHFDSVQSLSQFAFSDPKAWKHSGDGSSFALELVEQSQYTPAFRSPFNIALVRDRVFGDFVLDVDLIQTGKEYGHRDMCLFFGVQDPSHFYYAHIATKTDDHAHNVFIVNGAPRTKISEHTTPGVNWGLNQWHHVRLERIGPKVRVFFDDMVAPVMSAENKEFGVGWVGFGSFDDTGKVDSIRIWAPTEPVVRACEFFKTKP